MKILIADDNPMNLSLLRAVLEAEGHEVAHANDGTEALAVLAKESVDAVISDIFMPNMDGYRLCYEIRQNEKLKHLPFITFTATYTSAKDEQLSLGLGVDKFLRKPASAKEILAAVDEAVRSPNRQPSAAKTATEVLTEYSERLTEKLDEKMRVLEEREQELLVTHDQLRRLLSNSPAVLYSLNFVADTLVPTVVSDNVERLLGVTPAEASYEWWFNNLHPDEHERVLDTTLNAAKTGGYTMEYRIRHKDGAYRWVEDHNRVVYDEEGQPTEMVGVWTDITERKRSEAALRKSEELFREVLENVDLIAVTLNIDGEVVFCNDYLLRLTGWERREVLGNGWFDRFHSSDDLESKKAFSSAIREGNIPSHGEKTIQTRDGKLRMIVWNHTILRDADGNVTGSASIGADITERQSLQEQLTQSQKMESLGSLAGGVAHDFNNILTGVLGYAQLAEMKLSADSPAQGDLLEIQNAAKRGADLTKQLLTFARKELIDPQVVNVNDSMRSVENLLRRLLGENVHLTMSLSPDLGQVKIDPSQFEQIIMNLAVNGRDAMSGGGKLFIETHNVRVEEPIETHDSSVQPAEYIVVSVTDDGAGIAKEIQSQVFDPFFTTKEKGKGTGLGLSTCYGIARNAGGHIRLYSEPGTGTTFRIYLPRVDQTASETKPSLDVQPMGRGETVLVVEDEESVRSIATQLLTRSGYLVLEAPNGQAALDLIGAHTGPIDLLITDVIMPVMSGRELIEKLHTLRPDVKAIYMSGYTDDAMVHLGVLTQNLAFLQKPFTSAKLNQKVRAVLDSPMQESGGRE